VLEFHRELVLIRKTNAKPNNVTDSTRHPNIKQKKRIGLIKPYHTSDQNQLENIYTSAVHIYKTITQL